MNYTDAMRSVADQLREADQERLRSLTAAERVELALSLGRDDLEAFCLATGMAPAQGLKELRQRRQLGRTRCSFLNPDP